MAPIAVGVAAGALVGSAANPTRPLPLDAALVRFITDRGLKFGGFQRLRWNSVRVVFGHGANFYYVDALVSPNRASFPSVEAVEDALYDDATSKIEERARNLVFR